MLAAAHAPVGRLGLARYGAGLANGQLSDPSNRVSGSRPVLPGIGFQLRCLGGRQNVCRVDFPSGQSGPDPDSGAGCTGNAFAEGSGAPSQDDWNSRINGRVLGGEKLVTVQPRNVVEVRCAGDIWQVCAEASGGAGPAASPPGKRCLRNP